MSETKKTKKHYEGPYSDPAHGDVNGIFVFDEIMSAAVGGHGILYFYARHCRYVIKEKENVERFMNDFRLYLESL